MPQVTPGASATYSWAICDWTSTATHCAAKHPTLFPSSAPFSNKFLLNNVPAGTYRVVVTARHRTCAGPCAPVTAGVRVSVSSQAGLACRLRLRDTQGNGFYSPSDALIVESEAQGGAVSGYLWTMASAGSATTYDLKDPLVSPTGDAGVSMCIRGPLACGGTGMPVGNAASSKLNAGTRS